MRTCSSPVVLLTTSTTNEYNSDSATCYIIICLLLDYFIAIVYSVLFVDLVLYHGFELNFMVNKMELVVRNFSDGHHIFRSGKRDSSTRDVDNDAA
jgi:hypothetical protein